MKKINVANVTRWPSGFPYVVILFIFSQCSTAQLQVSILGVRWWEYNQKQASDDRTVPIPLPSSSLPLLPSKEPPTRAVALQLCDLRLDVQVMPVQLHIQVRVTYLHRRKKQAEVTFISSFSSGHCFEWLCLVIALLPQSIAAQRETSQLWLHLPRQSPLSRKWF
jgi:hypothetical protein